MEVSNNPKKVLYVITKGTWGGAQRYVFDLIQNAKDAGYEPMLAYGEAGLLVERAEALHVPCYRIPGLARDISFFNEFRVLYAHTTLMRRLQPDVVHVNSSKVGALGTLAARFAGIHRVIFTAHGWAFTESRSLFSKLFFSVAHYITVLLTDVTIAVSHAVRKKAVWWPFVGKKIVTIYLGASSADLFSKEAARAILIKREPSLSKNKDELWVGTIAELHKNKGLDVGIEAWKKAIPNASWLVLGDGEESRNLRTQALDVPSIHLLGFVEDAARLLPAFDVFMLPSRTEALAYVLLEAGLVGLPVVASDVGGVSEVIRDNETGLLVPTENTKALQQALSQMFGDKSRRDMLGNALRIYVTNTFALPRMLNETFAKY